MALTTCPECGGQISKSAKRCPHCGWEKKIGRTRGIIGGLTVAVGVFSFFISPILGVFLMLTGLGIFKLPAKWLIGITVPVAFFILLALLLE
jgi:hypothetical protein